MLFFFPFIFYFLCLCLFLPACFFSVCVFFYVSFYISVFLCLLAWMPLSLSVYLCLPVCLSTWIYLPVSLISFKCICIYRLSAWVYVCLCVFLYLSLCIYLSLSIWVACVSVRLLDCFYDINVFQYIHILSVYHRLCLSFYRYTDLYDYYSITCTFNWEQLQKSCSMDLHVWLSNITLNRCHRINIILHNYSKWSLKFYTGISDLTMTPFNIYIFRYWWYGTGSHCLIISKFKNI